MSYDIEFERIGRDHSPHGLRVNMTDPDDIAEAVFRHARKYLASSWFGVTVNLDTMTGVIEAGRFGRFTLREMAGG